MTERTSGVLHVSRDRIFGDCHHLDGTTGKVNHRLLVPDYRVDWDQPSKPFQELARERIGTREGACLVDEIQC
jgi:hypothetical protein